MIYIIRVFVIGTCIDCLNYIEILQQYCNKTPSQLEIIDIDEVSNIKLTIDSKIEGVPYVITYDINMKERHRIKGLKTLEEFENYLFENRFL